MLAGDATIDAREAFVRLGRNRCEPGWRFPFDTNHPPTEHALWFIWSGQGQFFADGRAPERLRPGILCLMPAGGRYEAIHDPDNRLGLTFIRFRSSIRAEVGGIPLVSVAGDFAYADAILRRIVWLGRAALVEMGNIETGRAAVRLFQAFLSDLRTGHHPVAAQPADVRTLHLRQIVTEVARSMMERPAEIDRITQLAANAATSQSQFSRAFSAAYGMSPKSFAVRARLARASDLLLETDLSVAEIAESLGYSSAQFFARQHKLYYGLTPSEARLGGRRLLSEPRTN